MGHKTEPVSQEWFTPQPYIEMVRRVLGGIELDPASSERANASVCARKYFTIANDGLAFPWTCETMFLNPPYGRAGGKSGPYNMPLWTGKLISEYERGRVGQAILLCNANTGTTWFRPLFDYTICFVDHRICFVDGSTGIPQKDPMYDQAFVYFGDDSAKFANEFGKIGSVVSRVKI